MFNPNDLDHRMDGYKAPIETVELGKSMSMTELAKAVLGPAIRERNIAVWKAVAELWGNLKRMGVESRGIWINVVRG